MRSHGKRHATFRLLHAIKVPNLSRIGQLSENSILTRLGPSQMLTWGHISSVTSLDGPYTPIIQN
jgi:hypothetical protein